MRSVFLYTVVALVLVAPFAQAASETDGTSRSGYDSPLKLNVGPGLSVLNGLVGYSLNFGIAHRIGGSNLYLGLDSGINYWSETGSASINGTNIGAQASLTTIGLLPTAYYRFDMGSRFTPYLGVSVGPAIAVGEVDVTVGNVTESSSATSVIFQGLARPGLEIDLGGRAALAVEPKFGFLRSEFVFMPQVSAVFPL